MRDELLRARPTITRNETHQDTRINDSQTLCALYGQVRVYDTTSRVVVRRHSSSADRVEDRRGIFSSVLYKLVIRGGIGRSNDIYTDHVQEIRNGEKNREIHRLTDDVFAEGGRSDVTLGSFDGLYDGVDVEAGVQ